MNVPRVLDFRTGLIYKKKLRKGEVMGKYMRVIQDERRHRTIDAFPINVFRKWRSYNCFIAYFGGGVEGPVIRLRYD